MEATEYVSPDGVTQTVDTPVVAVRLRARGWRPRTELEEAAPYDKGAAERLKLVQDRAEQREERRQQREDEASRQVPGGEQPDAEQAPVSEPVEPDVKAPAPVEPDVGQAPEDQAPEEKTRPEPKPKSRRRTGA